VINQVPTAPATPQSRIRVFLVDDHELVRRGLCDLLLAAREVTVVGECGSAAEAVRCIPRIAPDVVLMDVRLPDGSGIDVCRQVRALAPSVRVLMLTSYDDRHALIASARAGAAGFALKQIRGEALIQAVRSLATGRPVTTHTRSPGILDDPSGMPDLQEASPHSPAARSAGSGAGRSLESLSGQQQRVLQAIVDGLTNREIGTRLGIAEQTVKNHVSSVLAKLGVRYRTEAAVIGAEAWREPSWKPPVADGRTSER
jgi:DNA-binding NarL/FixJ family response regulator